MFDYRNQDLLVASAERTKKRFMTTDDEAETENEVRSKNAPAITAIIITIDAARNNEMFFEIITLKNKQKNISYRLKWTHPNTRPQ